MGGFHGNFITELRARCEALGSTANAEQKGRLVEWIVGCCDQDKIVDAGYLAVQFGCDVYTECSMRCAEFGY